jgi:phage terminase large subunit-like protein
MNDCIIGIETSITGISSVMVVTKEDEKIVVSPKFFMPYNYIGKREDAFLSKECELTLKKCNEFAEQGFLTLMDNNVIGYNYVITYIKWISKKYKVKGIAYDPWNSKQLANNLTAEGFICVEIEQGYQTLSEPSKELERLIIGELIIREYNPLFDWLLSNRRFIEDSNGNIKPNSLGIKALVMVLSSINLINEYEEELTATINIKPWYNTLTNELSKALIICVKKGMPIELASNMLEETLKNSIYDAVTIKGSSKEHKN